MKACPVHGAHEGECPICEALVAIKSAKALLEVVDFAEDETITIREVLRLHQRAIERLETVKLGRREDPREERWK